MPCKQREPGAVPGRSTRSFRSTALGVWAWLLTRLRQVRILRPEPIAHRGHVADAGYEPVIRKRS